MKRHRKILFLTVAILILSLGFIITFLTINKRSTLSGNSYQAGIPLNPYIFPDSVVKSDWRVFENGTLGLSLKTPDLPTKYDYIEGLNKFEINDSVWLQSTTVSRKREGHPSQHIIARRSSDRGNNWGDWYDIEPEGPPMTTYGSFFRHPKTGQVYYMYLKGPKEDLHYEKEPTDFLDIATFLGWYKGEPFRAYPHLVGKTVFRYVDEMGNFSPAHELQLPVSEIDRSTIFNGEYFVLYGVPVPRIFSGDDAISWTTKHGPIPRTGNGEAFFFRYVNYMNNDRLEEIEIELFPEGHGVSHPEYSNAGSFGPVIMNDSLWMFKHRTVYGFVGLARSTDKGLSWETDIIRYKPGGRPVKFPQGPFSFFRGPDNKSFLTYYNNSLSSFDEFGGRDLVFVSYYQLRNSNYYISEPELILYRKDRLGYLNGTSERLNTPHFSKNESNEIVARVSDKTQFRSFTIPSEFINMLSSQSHICEVPDNAMLYYKELDVDKIDSPSLPELNQGGGFAISFQLNIDFSCASGSLINSMQNGKGVKIDLLPDSTLLFTMSDGKESVELYSNKGIFTGGKPHHVAVITDGYPGLISMVVDRKFQDGGEARERGTVYFSHNFTDVNGSEFWEVSKEMISNLRIYNRVLLTTEIIGLQRADEKGENEK